MAQQVPVPDDRCIIIPDSLAVKIARYLGAGTIIVTGRNEKKLTELLTPGADTAILLSDLNSRLPVLFKDGIGYCSRLFMG